MAMRLAISYHPPMYLFRSTPSTTSISCLPWVASECNELGRERVFEEVVVSLGLRVLDKGKEGDTCVYIYIYKGSE